MLKPDPTGGRASNRANPDSWELGPELEDRFGSDRRDKRTAIAMDPADPELLAREIFIAAGQQDFGHRRRDYRTGALTAATVALSLFLGWMVGRAGWSMAVHQAEMQSPDLSESLAAAGVLVSPSVKQSSDDIQSTHSSPAVSPPDSVPESPLPKKNEPTKTNADLMVFQHGKAVFRAMPSEAKAQIQGSEDGDTQPVSDQVSRTATNNYLLTRVVPKYPEQAKQQHIQGPVVLNALVGRDGLVQGVNVISGDPELVQAAVTAVKQWRFQPQMLEGNPVEFETRVTVNFSLP
jgi:TonB family protein